MSLFEAPLLKRETVPFAGTELTLYELSAFDRCEYLEKSTDGIPPPKEGEVPAPEFDHLGQLWALHRADVSNRLLLVAYALKPAREESLEQLHEELCRSVAPDQVDDLYIPAAKLSGLYVPPEKAPAEESDEDAEEDPAKKE
ncbi:hypothetical protein [Microbulbifer sp. SAOS-129_SWC]|uniref:hypothetical protein n=1 Tax=Microbulbifer sp. SAOS-129_SWC TaxID=3145235 RepID=UPI003216BE0E